MARIRVTPEDFIVEEIPLYPTSGEGDHTFLWVEKRLENTDDLARTLAKAAGVQARDVGYAGRKDRIAVTRQHFSLPKVDPEEALALEVRGAKVLEARRHGNKLRTGQLAGNIFIITLREVDDEAYAAAEVRFKEMLQFGMPNRFGNQRFGRGGQNAARGRELLLGKKTRLDRKKARFLLSALQSEVFNEVMARRPVPIHELELGDVVMKHESRGCFRVEDLDAEAPRAAAFEISPAGPIFGTKTLETAGEVALREQEVMLSLGIPPVEEWSLPRGLSLKGARRAMRVPVPETTLDRGEDGSAVLKTVLPPGSYVTVLLQELFGEIQEGAPLGDEPPTPE
jgi:tRNA pseudouridine13 synthase